MLFWLAWAVGLLVIAFVIGCFGLHIYIFVRYIPAVLRIFQEKPFFFAPLGQPRADAENVTISSTNGVTLHGFYLKANGPRRGVILFGPEYGANRWSSLPYCGFLQEQGYDIFAFEPRGQGQSKAQEGYEPLQWVTQFEVEDFRAAVEYLKKRPDRDERGIGFFGISKGAGAGLIVAAGDPFVRCCVTDGVFGTFTTMVPYEKRWILIYSKKPLVARFLPDWYYRHAAAYGLKLIAKERRCKFVHLEPAMRRLAPRPLLMIHGGADNYIKPEMAQQLFDRARQPKELWLVEGAKHNQALHVAGDEFKRRIQAFFDKNLASLEFEKKTSQQTAPVAHAAIADSKVGPALSVPRGTLSGTHA